MFPQIIFPILEKLTRTQLIIPYYHIVSDDKPLHVKHIYEFKNIKQFKDDLDFLLRHYSQISLFDVLDSLKTGRPLQKSSFLLTFDDGFREVYNVIAPILLEKGISATFFINSAFLDNKLLCYQHKASILIEHFETVASLKLKEKIKELLVKEGIEFTTIKLALLSIKYKQKDLLDEVAKLLSVDFNDYLLRKQPYLTSEQIRKLIKYGFTIGAHSIDHPLYSLLSLEDQLYQAIESIKQIREKFSLNYGTFAFPHSDYNVSTKFFVELYNTGLVDVSFGTGGIIDDSFSYNIQRVSLEKPLIPAERIIAWQFARKFAKQLMRKAKIIRK